MLVCGRLVVAWLLWSGWFPVAAAQDMDLVNATVIDGTGGPPRAAVSVIVLESLIAQILELTPPPVDGVRRFDLQGRFLLPGLIDAHSHIESPGAALRALQSGVTTARVLGIEARTGTIQPWMDVDLLVVERPWLARP